jgi:hypothetical protein
MVQANPAILDLSPERLESMYLPVVLVVMSRKRMVTKGAYVECWRFDDNFKMTESNSDLRPCPFCANDKLTIVHADGGRTITVMCSECKATGPRVTHTDPKGHAEHLWNLRYGVGIEH